MLDRLLQNGLVIVAAASGRGLELGKDEPFHHGSGRSFPAQEGFDRNDRINKMNAHMCELCRNYGFKFMNVAKELKDPATGCCSN